MTRVCRTTLVGFAALAMVAMVAALAEAQGPGAGGGGRGGRGGFGMGMGGPGGGMSASALLQNEQVQKELEIVADQKAALQKIAEEDRTAMREAMAGMRDLSQEERQAKMTEMRAKTQKKIDEVLLPPQAKRLKEIQLQVRGNNALLDKEVQKELKITDEQAKKLTAVQEESRTKMRELFQPGGDMAQMREKMTQLQKEVGDQMLGVLTADQKEAFTKMKGKEFKLDMSAMRGPGGRGGRGGRGGAGGGGQPGGN